MEVALVLRQFLNAPTEAQYGLHLMARCGLKSGTIYPLLKRLEQAGWIDGRLEDIDPVKAGRRPRRYYRLTEEGRAGAARELSALSERLRLPVVAG